MILPSQPAVTQPTSLWRSEGLHRFLLIVGGLIFALVLFEIPALLNILDYHSLELTGVWANPRFIRTVDPELRHIEPAHAHYVAHVGALKLAQNAAADDQLALCDEADGDQCGDRI